MDTVQAIPMTTTSTYTATVNVYDGVVSIDDEPGSGSERELYVGPWGVDEESLDRADAALIEDGWERVTDWDQSTIPTAQVIAR